MKRTRQAVRQRWALLGVLTLACGARTGLLDERERSQAAQSGNAALGGAASGGTPVAGGPFTGGTVTGGSGVVTQGGTLASAGTPGAAGAAEPFGGQAGASLAEAGAGGAAATPVLWGKRFGDESRDQIPYAIAVEANGIFTLTGELLGSADFGNGKLTSSDTDLFLAQFNGDGSPRWSALYGGLGQQQGLGVAVADDGLISLVGSAAGTLDFGGGPLAPGGNSDAFVAGFDHDGKYRFGKRFGDNDNQLATGVAVGSSGQQVWSGTFRSKLDVGGGQLTSNGSVDALIAGFDSQGDYSWALQGGNATYQRANAIAHAAGDDTFYVAGEMSGILKLGACSQLVSQGDSDAWLAWLDSSGNCLHALRFGDASMQLAQAVAAGKSGLSTLLAVVGRFDGTIDAGGALGSSGNDAFVMLLVVDRGTQTIAPQWIRRIGGSGSQFANAVAFDQQDNLIVVGSYQGTIDDDLLPPTAPSTYDAYAIKYAPNGNVVWAQSFGDDEVSQLATAVDTDAAGNVYVAGQFQGNIELSTGTLTGTAGSDDIFVLKLAP